MFRATMCPSSGECTYLFDTGICHSVWVVACRSQWPRGLRLRSAAAGLLGPWVRIPPGAWMFVCCECCVLSGRGLCDEMITRPDKSYRLWCVVVCDLENLMNEEAIFHCGVVNTKKWVVVSSSDQIHTLTE